MLEEDAPLDDGDLFNGPFDSRAFKVQSPDGDLSELRSERWPSGQGRSDVEGKTAIVTGAGSSIGRAAALHLAYDRTHVAIADVNPDTAAAVPRELHTLGIEPGLATRSSGTPSGPSRMRRYSTIVVAASCRSFHC